MLNLMLKFDRYFIIITHIKSVKVFRALRQKETLFSSLAIQTKARQMLPVSFSPSF